MFDVRYAAGLFDGEGCISISLIKRRNLTYRLYANMTMTHRPVIEAMRQQFGGSIGTIYKDLKNPQHLRAYVWTVASCTCADFLKQVLPYLFIKKEEAELALQFQETVNRWKHLRGTGWNNPEMELVRAERAAFRQQMQALKHRAGSPYLDSDPMQLN